MTSSHSLDPKLLVAQTMKEIFLNESGQDLHEDDIDWLFIYVRADSDDETMEEVQILARYYANPEAAVMGFGEVIDYLKLTRDKWAF